MPLDYTQRPAAVQNRIDEKFSEFSRLPESGWTMHNGYEEYNMCRLSDTKFVKHIVQSKPNQGSYYFLDVGAGRYQWVDHMAKSLCGNGEAHTPQYHFIGVNAEGSDNITTIGNCTIHKLGGFKTENMLEAFKERGFDLEGNVDLIVSHFTLRHLVDPLGTFLQMYDLVRPTGFLLVDGVVFDRLNPDHQSVYRLDSTGVNLNVEYFLGQDLSVPYLMCPVSDIYRIATRDVLVQKYASTSSISSLSYFDKGDSNWLGFISESYATPYDKLPPCMTRTTHTCTYFSGNATLFDMLVKHDLFVSTEPRSHLQHNMPESDMDSYRMVGFHELCGEHDPLTDAPMSSDDGGGYELLFGTDNSLVATTGKESCMWPWPFDAWLC